MILPGSLDGRARCPRCAALLNDERHPENFTTGTQGINLCMDCQSNESEKRDYATQPQHRETRSKP